MSASPDRFDQLPKRASVAAGMRAAAEKLLASCSTRFPPVSLTSSKCAGGIASHVRT